MLTREDLARITAAKTANDPETVKAILNVFFAETRGALSSGKGIDLGAEFGRLIIKEREGGTVNENSPRAPTAPHYTVVFKASSKLKKQLYMKDTEK